MAEAVVEVIARAVGFEQLAAETRNAMKALQEFGNAAKSIGTGSFARSFSRDFSQIETHLAELRKSFRITGEYARGKLGSGISLGLSQAIKTPELMTKFRATGEELGRAMRQGVQAGMNAGGSITPPPPGGRGSGSGGSSGRPGQSTFQHVRDNIGGVVVGSVAGHAAVRATESIFEQAGALVQVRSQLKSQGISDDDIADVERTARETSAKYRATSVSRLLQQYGEFRTVFASADEAKAFMPIGAQVDLALKNLQSAESWAKTLDPEQAQLDIAKAIEMKGDAMNPEKARADADAMLKAMAAFKGQIQPSDFLLAFKYARGSLRGFSDEFLFQILPTLIAEFKSRGGQGGPAGVAMQSYYRTVLKGNFGKAKDEWSKLGLLDANGRVIDLDLARSNPPQWWRKDVSPKLAGMTPAQQKDQIARLFPTAIPEQMAVIFQNDALRLQKDAANIRAAAGLDQLQKDFENAPTQAMAEFSAQFKNLLAALGDPAMPAAIGTLKGLAGVFSSITGLMHEHPLAGGGLAGGALAAGGYAAYRLLPKLLSSPLGRFALGAISGGLMGGGLEALIFGGVLGATAPTGGAAPGLSRLRNVVGGGGLLGRIGAATGLTAASAKIAGWISKIGVLKTVLGGVGRLIGVLSTIGVAAEIGQVAASTKTGSAMLDTFWKEVHAIMNGSQSHGNAHIAKKAYWHSENVARANILGLGPKGPPPSYLSTLIGDGAKYATYGRHNGPYPEWLKHMHAPEQSWFSSHRMSGPGARGGGGNAGPVPVIITQMPKGTDRPNNVTTNVTVNVQTNASPQAIGGAVGSAVGSKVSNALSDQHH